VPIYEYQCDACGHNLEILQKISDDLLTVCPECNEERLRKLVTAAAFHLKGTGWYVTDFKDKKTQKGTDKTGDKSGGDNKSAGDASKSEGSKESKSSGTESSTTTPAKKEKSPSSE
jgi:putative FmdB family regulatory protein